jgi:hypothetical protein
MRLILATAIVHLLLQSVAASEITNEDTMSYLVETVCPYGDRVELSILHRDCLLSRLRRFEDRPLIHRHDWPGVEDAVSSPSGYQRSDAYLTLRGSQPVAVHTFDFGTGGRTFGVFDQGKGDGGQIAEMEGPAVTFTMTEDGGDGVQWFVGPRCWGGDPLKSGWLVFMFPLEDQWTQSIVRLAKARSRQGCPLFFSKSLTRWRRQSIEWPFLQNGKPGSPHLLSTVISEHFGGHDIETSGHLERFFLAKGVGLVRWERWQNPSVRGRDSFFAQAENLALSRRCPAVDGSIPPSSGWLMIDCRIWTNLVQTPEDEPDSFDWYHGE